MKLRHPNIVQFLGAVTERKPLMLITEYLRGVYCCIFYFVLKDLSVEDLDGDFKNVLLKLSFLNS